MASLPATVPTLTHNPTTKTLSLIHHPPPSPSESEPHLIHVRATALTNGELTWPEPAEQSPPIPGYEASGVVVSAPPDSPYPPGTEVYRCTGAWAKGGNARAYATAATRELGRKPKNLSWEEAAAVPLSALTAWQWLFVHGGLTAPGEAGAEQDRGKRVLITAAAGGVGIFAVQLAKMAGVGCVVGTCGSGNVEFVKGLGADEVLDYREVRDLAAWSQEHGKFDMVLDGVGGETLKDAWRAAKSGGMVISIALPADTLKPDEGVEEGVRSLWFIVEGHNEQLDRITELIEGGGLKTVMDSALPLTEFQKAFDRVNAGHVRGKVVLSIPWDELSGPLIID